VEQGNKLVSTVGQLADAVHAQAEEIRLQRVQDQEFRAAEAERNRLFNILLTKFVEKQDKWYLFLGFVVYRLTTLQRSPMMLHSCGADSISTLPPPLNLSTFLIHFSCPPFPPTSHHDPTIHLAPHCQGSH
jgi:hypothetical protein